MTIALGLLILRVVTGLIMAAHGSQKLLGWFKGPGFAGVTGWLQSMGFKPAPLWALFAALGEFGGGLLLALGLLTPLASVAIIAVMVMAIFKLKIGNGFWSSNSGYEFDLLLLASALAFGLAGPGNYSLDAAIGFSLPIWVFIVVLVLAIIVDTVGIAISRQPAPQQSAA